MKKFHILLGVALICFSAGAKRMEKKPPCELKVMAEWVDLDEKERTETFGGRWVKVATFIIKRRSKDTIPLQEINLAWNGEKIDHLDASLFRKKDPYGDFAPLEENLVCDGIWHNKDQILQLKFNEREYLQPTTIYCLVLTVQQPLEKKLKTGHFALLSAKLPRQLQPAAEQKQFKISMLAQNKNRRSHRLTRMV